MSAPLMDEPSLHAQALYLRTLPAIRTRCTRVHNLAKKGALQYFDYHPEKLDAVIEFCSSTLDEKNFLKACDKIPPQGRWRHLDAGRPRIQPLLQSWSAAGVETKEQCKRLLDLIFVSVLLDAGAGNTWSYKEPGMGDVFTRSEGLSVASVHMFTAGLFSGSISQPHRVDAKGLARITADQVAEALQVSASNPIVGLAGRTTLLTNLSVALASNHHFFGEEARPGNLLDFLEARSTSNGQACQVPIAALWSVLTKSLSPIWPSRLSLGGVPLGDVWICPALRKSSESEFKPATELNGDGEASAQVEVDPECLVPLHKLTSWLTYSLVEPIQTLLGWTFEGTAGMTGLAEYRNGGLLIDLGVLTLRPGVLSPADFPDGDQNAVPRLPPSHPAVVEWRAMTVIELDHITKALRTKYRVSSASLTLALVLDGVTWNGGRQIAKIRRPDTGGPPIDIISDGTVF